MTSREQTRALVEGAFFTGLTAMFLFINFYVPMFSLVAGLAGPIPTAVLIKRYNLKIAVLSLTAAILITILIYGNLLAALLFTVQIGGMGILLGILLKQNISAGVGILLSAWGAVFMSFFVFWVTFLVTGVNPFDVAREVRQTVQEMYKIYAQSGAINSLNERELYDLQNKITSNVTVFLPGNLAVLSLISGALDYLLTRELFKRLKYKVTALTPFSYWHFPWFSTWIIILGLGLLLLSDSFNINFLSIVAKNILYISAFIFLVLGLSVAIFFINKFAFSKVLKMITLFMAIIYWPLAVIILLSFGILDPYFNFRRFKFIKE